ncbi:MAG TPA: nuclear transport factor 2 family protein [Myxococcota bacterium]|nr:nuclear transport factor 2 family protein [Myxococcota bacterium]
MTASHHQIVRDFLAALSRGDLRDDMLTSDFSGWTVISGPIGRQAYQRAFEIFPRIFAEGPSPTIHSLTAEGDRVVAEFRSQGTLLNGDVYQNDYLFLFRIRDGQIAYIGEYFNPDVVRAKIAPAMAAAMARGNQARRTTEE